MALAFLAVGVAVLALARGSPALAVLCVQGAILALLAGDQRNRP